MKLLRLTLLGLLVSLPAWLLGAGPVKKGAVTAELVSAYEAAVPGKSVWVALKLDHEEHWHSYWINPGTGYPTSLKWTLPAGFTAGPIVWPTPHVVKDTRGQITGHGYEGTVYLFTEIKVPDNASVGQPVTLKAKADWLMCKDVCMPGDANLELTLAIVAENPAPNMKFARLVNNAYADLPKPIAGWNVTAERTADAIVVRIKPTGSGHDVADVHLFDNDGLVDYAAPQTATTQDGAQVLTLKPAADAGPDAQRLSGVLYSRTSWGPMFGSKGALFDVELKPAGAAAVEGPKSKVEGQTTSTPQSSSSGGQATASNPQPSTLNSQPPAPRSALGTTLVLALVGGLILNLMPCVFPVLGIKVLGFVNQSGSDRSKVVAHGLVFTFGVLLSFWILAGILLALRAGGEQLGWGAQLQSPAFVFGMAAFLLIFSLNLSGLFEIGLSATGVGGKLQMQQGYVGSFFTGVLAVLVSTPCSAPFLAPALGAAFSNSYSATESMLIFTCIGLGLSLPYLILSIFPAAVKALPRPGAWMETFKQFMAFPLYATVAWLLWVLAGQTKDNDNALLHIGLGLVIIAMAAWIYGRFHKPLSRVIAALLLVGGLWLGWPKTTEPAQGVGHGYVVKWEHWSPEAVTAARAAGRTIYVDFTARWCATCQTNKAVVFNSKDVLLDLEKRNVLLLKADWTSKDPAITTELARWNRSAVPFNLIYAPDRADPIILPELLTPGIVLEALAQTPAK